jgi:hypothetical protein
MIGVAVRPHIDFMHDAILYQIVGSNVIGFPLFLDRPRTVIGGL